MDLANLEVTQGELSQLLPITDRHLRNLRKTIPPSGKRGTSLVYVLGKAVQAYINHLTENQKEQYTTQDVRDAKARREIALAIKEEALARSAQVAAARDEGSVALIEDVQRFVATNNSRVKAKLINQIPGISAKLVGIRKPERAQEILMEFANVVLAELSIWSAEDKEQLEAPVADHEE